MEQHELLNTHNKQEHPPMHTAEHILNGTMVKMFGCKRSHNAHIERKKSKCDYFLPYSPTPEDMEIIEKRVNKVIESHLPVTTELLSHEEAKRIADLSKLPQQANGILRIVHIGHYDTCACIGEHVQNTSEIGIFKIISHDYNNDTHILRLRFKLL